MVGCMKVVLVTFLDDGRIDGYIGVSGRIDDYIRKVR